MNPRYSALIQLVDYPTRTEHLAVGDLICIEGAWRKVTKVQEDSGAPGFYYADYDLTGPDGFHGQLWGALNGAHNPPGIPRIPGVLLDLLHPEGHPYR